MEGRVLFRSLESSDFVNKS